MKQTRDLFSFNVSRARKLYAPVKTTRLSHDRLAGYLLPIVIALGLGIGVAGVTALGAISQNSQSLSNQYYNQLASEAALSGTQAAIGCIDNNQMDWDTGGHPKLQPQTDCHGQTVAGKPAEIYSDITIKTTYAVDALQNPYSDTSRVITSTGTVAIKIANGTIIQKYSKTIRLYGKVNFNDGSQVTEQISAGGGDACVLVDGAPYCWGGDFYGQLGDGKISGGQSAYVPVAVDTSGVLKDKTLTAISTSPVYGFTCTVGSGQAFCWGNNTSGQLGDGKGGQYNSTSSVPVAVKTNGVLNGKTVTDISTGNTHTCAVASGQAYCWGDDSFGQLGDGRSGTNVQSIVPVAVKTNGVLAGKTVTKISAGNGLTCAIADGKAYCWGGSGCGGALGNGQCGSAIPVAVDTSGVLNGKTVTDISTNNGFACVVASGQAYCWGDDQFGQLGNGNSGWGADSFVPVAVKTNGVLAGKTVTRISAGFESTCAIADGKAYCWGGNSTGQLGDGTTTDRSTPVAVYASGLLAGKTVTDISGGGADGNVHRFSCAIADSKAYCWGDNSVIGSIGDGTNDPSTVPVEVALAGVGNHQGPVATVVSAGDNFACGVIDSRAYCWGYDLRGRLGHGDSTVNSWSYIPLAVSTAGALGTQAVTDISANDHTCAVANSKAYCWGDNAQGQLGDGTKTDRHLPVAVNTSGVLNGKTVTGISVNGYSSCAVADGKAYCWGWNSNGQLGDGTSATRLTPVAVSTSGVLAGKTVTKISAGGRAACAIADGKAYCWGMNSYGALGVSSGASSSVPLAVDTSGVLAGKTVTDISVGDEGGTGHTFTCAVADGKAYCWGSNYSNTLGTGAQGLTQSNVPMAVNASGALAGKTVTAISADNDHACAIADGAAYCWGAGGGGALGTGTNQSSSVPVAVNASGALSGKTMTAINAGWSNGGAGFSCGIASGSAYCWGDNSIYGIGNGTSAGASAPSAISTIAIPWPLYSFDNRMLF